MKNPDFLAKLSGEGRLGLVEPSENIKQSYIEKSESNLISSKILLSNNRLEEAVSLAYYSMYHMLAALLFRTGIKSENHSASIILLKELFKLDNSDIAFAKKERIDKQYYVNFKITKSDVIDLMKKAEAFDGRMRDFISRLTVESVKEYRKQFNSIVK